MNADDPRHGTNAGHCAGCREKCCTDAKLRYDKRRKYDQIHGRVRTVDPTGTVRRVRALMAIGWTLGAIGEAANLSPRTLHNPTFRGKKVTVRTAEGVAHAYDLLSMTVPVGPLNARQRRNAKKRGWVPPLGWDDHDLDNPEATPRDQWKPRADLPDEAVIERFLAGDDVPTTRAEREAIVARWRESGRSLHELEARTGWRTSRYYEVAS